MPYYLSIGVTEEKFYRSTPRELKPYVRAFEISQQTQDRAAWESGYYTMDAVFVAVAKCLNGRKARVEYMKKPIHADDLAEKRKAELEDQMAGTCADFEKFSAYALAYNAANANKSKDGQE